MTKSLLLDSAKFLEEILLAKAYSYLNFRNSLEKNYKYCKPIPVILSVFKAKIFLGELCTVQSVTKTTINLAVETYKYP